MKLNNIDCKPEVINCSKKLKKRAIKDVGGQSLWRKLSFEERLKAIGKTNEKKVCGL
jgi:hypothetical protein